MTSDTKSLLAIAGILFLGMFGYFIITGNNNNNAESLDINNQTTSESLEFDEFDSNSIVDEFSLEDNMQQSTLSQPDMIIDPSKNYSAILKTTKGDITIDLNEKMTPITVNNFVYLSRENFYNNVIFHRVIEGFMIQGGDPTGTGAGDPGYRFDDEPFEGEYTRGTVAMANSGPNTNGSQFFIMHQDNPLPPAYVIFGRVTSGMDVVDAIATDQVTMSPSGVDPSPSTPVNPTVIQSVEIIEE